MNKKIIIPVVTVVILMIVGILGIFATNTKKDTNSTEMSGMNTSTIPTTNNEPQNTNQIKIENYTFAPKTTTVKKGTIVTWTNIDTARHDVAGKNGGPKSTLLGKGQSYSYTFNEAGTFEYNCTPHPYMTGSVVVME